MDVLIVDDQRSNLLIFSKLVERAAECVAHQFRDPLAALLATHSRTFDLVLVDYRMPGMDGISLLKQIRELPRYAEVPIVMITADGDREVVRAALQAGATEFVSKPVDPVEFHHRIKNLLQLRNAQLQLQRHTQELETRVVRSVETIAEREIEIIQRLSRAAERRDNETGNHVVRMALLSRIIAEGMGLSENTAKTLYVAAPLHDVGKIGLPDSILLKPGPLTAEERREMERHTLVGHEILAGSSSELIQRAAEIALHHHERWDGAGYPHGLVGAAIPLWARIAAVADVCDALASERPYKRAWALDDVQAYFVEKAGTQFDPQCIDAVLRRWAAVSALYSTPHELQHVA